MGTIKAFHCSGLSKMHYDKDMAIYRSMIVMLSYSHMSIVIYLHMLYFFYKKKKTSYFLQYFLGNFFSLDFVFPLFFLHCYSFLSILRYIITTLFLNLNPHEQTNIKRLNKCSKICAYPNPLSGTHQPQPTQNSTFSNSPLQYSVSSPFLSNLCNHSPSQMISKQCTIQEYEEKKKECGERERKERYEIPGQCWHAQPQQE